MAESDLSEYERLGNDGDLCRSADTMKAKLSLMAGRYNEGKALDAVLRRIEARDRALRMNDGRSPDELNDPDPLRRVDYACTVGDVLYAFEHTGIEPFGNQIELEVHNKKLFGPVNERFDHRTDRELWELHVPVEASAGLTGDQVNRVRDALIKWIEENAPRFPVTQLYDRYANPSLGETPPDVPFPVSLHRGSLDGPHFPREHPLCGRFMVKYFVSGDLEQARTARLQKACEAKFPKLAKWKRDAGARTVLVLEENDISLTNHQRVADALGPAEATMADTPDEIFLVSTHIANTWWVTCLRRAGKSYYDDGERFHEVDPATLNRLTLR
jgi:hypothetical protein